MSKKISIIAIALLAIHTCYVADSAILKQKNSNIQLNLESTDRIPQFSKMFNDQPYDSLETFHNKLSPSSTELIDPMKTSASHHHHKKGAKGWLDMGAWTKKKGAFGWYADFPVGKGR